MNKYLAIIGTAYPEMSGATNITELFFKNAQINGLNIMRFKYKVSFYKEKRNVSIFESKLSKLISFIKIYGNLILSLKKINAAYIQENSGLGKLYDISFMLLFIVLKKKCFYHNHGYKKINKYDVFAKITQIISVYGIKNIFQTELEANNFIRIYGPTSYTTISNSIFIKSPEKRIRKPLKNGYYKFGLISNLNKAKGLDLFIEIAQNSLLENNGWSFYLAGPILKKKDYYADQIRKTKNIKYYGPIFELIEKENFYQNIDFFIFLSTYKHESESLVILESISNGCIPIVYDQGQVATLTPDKKLIMPSGVKVYPLLKNLVKDIENENQFISLSNDSINLFRKLKKTSQDNMSNLMIEIKKILQEK